MRPWLGNSSIPVLRFWDGFRIEPRSGINTNSILHSSSGFLIRSSYRFPYNGFGNVILFSDQDATHARITVLVGFPNLVRIGYWNIFHITITLRSPDPFLSGKITNPRTTVLVSLPATALIRESINIQVQRQRGYGYIRCMGM